ncbi:acyl carrier protein [Mariniphaga sp.]|uniref:acyl carrier protein n=1 Tax=Mariniphaga sp. TaxID=1954475 RepID=UPI003561DE08
MITLDEFLKRFCEELEDVELNNIDTSTDFKNIDEWDSLVALSIIAMIDEEFEIRVTGSDLMKSKTIEDLYILIQNKLQ